MRLNTHKSFNKSEENLYSGLSGINAYDLNSSAFYRGNHSEFKDERSGKNFIKSFETDGETSEDDVSSGNGAVKEDAEVRNLLNSIYKEYRATLKSIREGSDDVDVLDDDNFVGDEKLESSEDDFGDDDHYGDDEDHYGDDEDHYGDDDHHYGDDDECDDDEECEDDEDAEEVVESYLRGLRYSRAFREDDELDDEELDDSDVEDEDADVDDEDVDADDEELEDVDDEEVSEGFTRRRGRRYFREDDELDDDEELDDEDVDEEDVDADDEELEDVEDEEVSEGFMRRRGRRYFREDDELDDEELDDEDDEDVDDEDVDIDDEELEGDDDVDPADEVVENFMGRRSRRNALYEAYRKDPELTESFLQYMLENDGQMPPPPADPNAPVNPDMGGDPSQTNPQGGSNGEDISIDLPDNIDPSQIKINIGGQNFVVDPSTASPSSSNTASSDLNGQLDNMNGQIDNMTANAPQTPPADPNVNMSAPAPGGVQESVYDKYFSQYGSIYDKYREDDETADHDDSDMEDNSDIESEDMDSDDIDTEDLDDESSEDLDESTMINLINRALREDDEASIMHVNGPMDNAEDTVDDIADSLDSDEGLEDDPMGDVDDDEDFSYSDPTDDDDELDEDDADVISSNGIHSDDMDGDELVDWAIGQLMKSSRKKKRSFSEGAYGFIDTNNATSVGGSRYMNNGRVNSFTNSNLESVVRDVKDSFVSASQQSDIPYTERKVCEVSTPTEVLPIAENAAWNSIDAEKTLMECAYNRGSNVNFRFLKATHLYWEGTGFNKDDYKFPIADIVDGQAQIIPQAIIEASNLFSSPVFTKKFDNVTLNRIRGTLDYYLEQMGRVSPWKSGKCLNLTEASKITMISRAPYNPYKLWENRINSIEKAKAAETLLRG